MMPYRFHGERGGQYFNPYWLVEQMRQALGLDQSGWNWVNRVFLALQVSILPMLLFTRVRSLTQVVQYSVLAIYLFVTFGRVDSPQWILWTVPPALIVRAGRADADRGGRPEGLHTISSSRRLRCARSDGRRVLGDRVREGSHPALVDRADLPRPWSRSQTADDCVGVPVTSANEAKIEPDGDHGPPEGGHYVSERTAGLKACTTTVSAV